MLTVNNKNYQTQKIKFCLFLDENDIQLLCPSKNLNLSLRERNNWASTRENLSSGLANNKGADQPAHPRSLISAFVIRFLERIIFKFATSEISTFELVSVAEETDLKLALTETPKTGFLATRPNLCKPALQRECKTTIDGYCKFGKFRECFIFAKLRICEVS